MIYSVVLVLGVQQSESIICVHIPALQHSFPGWVITEYWVEFPVLYSRSLQVVYFMCVYVEKEMATHSSSLAGETRGQRSLAGSSPRGLKVLDTT